MNHIPVFGGLLHQSYQFLGESTPFLLFQFYCQREALYVPEIVKMKLYNRVRVERWNSSQTPQGVNPGTLLTTCDIFQVT